MANQKNDGAKTIVLTEEQVNLIVDTVNFMNPTQVTRSVDEIAQALLNHTSDMHTDIGEDFYTVRQLRKLYESLFPTLEPLAG